MCTNHKILKTTNSWCKNFSCIKHSAQLVWCLHEQGGKFDRYFTNQMLTVWSRCSPVSLLCLLCFPMSLNLQCHVYYRFTGMTKNAYHLAVRMIDIECQISVKIVNLLMQKPDQLGRSIIQYGYRRAKSGSSLSFSPYLGQMWMDCRP